MTARPSDRFIPWYIVLFFVVQFPLFGWFAWLACSTYTGVVMDKAYDKGIKYNDTIEKAEQQEKLGWTSDIATKHVSAGEVEVTFSLKDKSGAPVTGAAVRLWLIRPVQDGMDQHLIMKAVGEGVYQVTAKLPAPGLWEMRVEAVKDQARYQVAKRGSL